MMYTDTQCCVFHVHMLNDLITSLLCRVDGVVLSQCNASLLQ